MAPGWESQRREERSKAGFDEPLCQGQKEEEKLKVWSDFKEKGKKMRHFYEFSFQ